MFVNGGLESILLLGVFSYFKALSRTFLEILRRFTNIISQKFSWYDSRMVINIQHRICLSILETGRLYPSNLSWCSLFSTSAIQ